MLLYARRDQLLEPDQVQQVVLPRGAARDFAPERLPFAPVGMGKPLTVQVREVYSGAYGGRFLGLVRAQLLITSAVKSLTTFDAAPLAINWLQRRAVEPGRRWDRPAADEDGTPYVFYSPAVVDPSLSVTLKLMFANLQPKQVQGVADMLGKAFQGAAGIPVFAPAMGYLLAAGSLVKVAGNLAGVLLQREPTFLQTESIDMAQGGRAPALAGYYISVDDGLRQKHEPNFADDYHVDDEGVVRHKDSGDRYSGGMPYVLFSLDGAPREDLKEWTARAASAAILEEFLGGGDAGTNGSEVVLDALRLYNDFNLTQKIKAKDAEIAAETDDAKKAALKLQREALAKNVLTDVMKKAV